MKHLNKRILYLRQETAQPIMDDMRLDIMYAVQDHEVYMNAKCYAGKPGHQKEIFYGTIGGDAVEGFLAFCRENSVVMEVFDESEL